MKSALQFRKISRLTPLRILCALAVSILVSGLVSSANAQQAAAAPAGPDPQLPQHESAPPAKPQVTYDGANLSIVADNATLSEILSAVRERTSAEIEIPEGASGERIPEVKLGPGPSRDVLGTLLGWTNFDYIMQAPEANPYGIQSVMLFARDKTSAVGASANPVAPLPPPVVDPTRLPGQDFRNRGRFGGGNAFQPRPGDSPDAPPAGRQVAPAVTGADSNQPQGAPTPQTAQGLQQLFQQRRQAQQQGQPQPQGQ